MREDVQRVVEMMPVLKNFILTASEILSAPKEYGDSKVNSAEMQTLNLVAQKPGVKITDIATDRGRSLAAASRKVDRLVEKGYLEKRKLSDNKKNICLFLTDQGQRIADHYMQCDCDKLAKEAEHLLDIYTLEEIEKFFEMVKTMQQIVEEEFYV